MHAGAVDDHLFRGFAAGNWQPHPDLHSAICIELAAARVEVRFSTVYQVVSPGCRVADLQFHSVEQHCGWFVDLPEAVCPHSHLHIVLAYLPLPHVSGGAGVGRQGYRGLWTATGELFPAQEEDCRYGDTE